MSNCKKDHSEISSIMNELPIEQGGPGRHKCAACAYEIGYSDGYSRVFQIDINSILENLPTSQAGSQRHKSAHLGYFRGYYDGLMKSYQETDAFVKQEEKVIEYPDNSEPLKVEEDEAPKYNIAPHGDSSFNEEDDNLETTDEPHDILNYKVADLLNHSHYLFNDFNNKLFKVRTCNALHAQGIITLEDVLDYSGNILDIPRAGRKAQLEFEYLKEYIKSLAEKLSLDIQIYEPESQNPNEDNDKQDKASILLSSLSREKRMIAEYDYKHMLKDVDNHKAMIFISKYSFEEFVKAFCYKGDDEILNTWGVGRNKSDTIIFFRDFITEYLEQLSSNDYTPLELNWELITRQLSLELQSDYENSSGQELREYYIANTHLPVFKLLDLIFYKFSNASGYGSCFVQKFFRNANEFDCINEDISNERKRQKAVEVLSILKNRNSKISNSDTIFFDCISAFCYLLNSDEHIEYIKHALSDKDIVSADDINNLLVEEKCKYLQSREALSFISLGLVELYQTNGGLFNDDKYENIFLIKKELFDVYNFTKAISFFREKYESQHTSTEVFNIPIFVKDGFEYWSGGITQYEYVERITSVLSVLIRKELDLGDRLLMDVLTLEPNAQVSPKDIIFEALKSIGKPSTPEEILQKLEESETHANSTIDDVRYYLRNDSRIVFTKFEGRYDLVTNKPDIGSYRYFIRKILSESIVPLSPEDIYELLPESRKVGFDKFRPNLAVFREAKRYIGGLYGLCDKTYDKKYILDIQNFTPGDKLAKITIFYRDNNRLPKASDGPEWQQLRNWWDSLSYRSDTLSAEELKNYSELKAEIANPGQGSRFDSDFLAVANKIKAFIISNHRMPSADSENADESILGQWFIKQEKKMLQEILSPNQMSIFIVLLKIKSRYVN